MSKDSGSQSATQIQDIPEWAQPYSRALLSSGAAAAGQPYQQYEGQQTAALNSAQQTAMGLTSGIALNGDPTTNTALGQLANTAAGNYANPYATTYNPYALTGNPQLQSMIDSSNAAITKNYQQAVKPGTDSMFARAGAFGGSAYTDKVGQDQQQLAGALANNTSNLQFQDYANKSNLMQQQLTMGNQDYENERQRQIAAAGTGLQGDQIDLNRAKALAGAGDAQQQYTQTLLNNQYAEFQRQQQYPWQQIDQLGAVLGKALGGSSQTTSTMSMPQQYGGVSGALGGAMAGYGASQMMPNSMFGQALPWLGAGLGAIG